MVRRREKDDMEAGKKRRVGEGKDDMGAVEQMKATGEMGEEGGDIGDIKDGCDDEMEGTSVTVTVTM